MKKNRATTKSGPERGTINQHTCTGEKKKENMIKHNFETIDHHSRIVGGSSAGLHEFPWVAGLFQGIGYSPFCGGAIVSDR